MSTKLVCLFFFFVAIHLSGCTPSVPQDSACHAQQIVFDKSIFPPAAKNGDFLSPISEMPVNSAFRMISLGKGIANQSVVVFSSERRAIEEFAFEEKIFGPYSKVEWEVPAELTYKSSLADQYHVACGQDGIYMCFMIGRYNNIYTKFNVHIYSDEVTVADVNGILEEIDSRMAKCLATK